MYSVCVSEVNLFCADWCPSKTKALILFKTGKVEHISEHLTPSPLSFCSQCCEARHACQALELNPLASHDRITFILLHEDTNILQTRYVHLPFVRAQYHLYSNRPNNIMALQFQRGCLLPRHVADEHPVAVAVLVHHSVLPVAVPVHQPCTKRNRKCNSS